MKAFRPNRRHSKTRIMWDTKRQIIWLVAGVSFGTFIVYQDAKDEFGRFQPSVFVFWEIILLAIIVTLFWLYSRQKT
jgi:cell division protein FtsW (lipid II flippase)